MAIATSGIAAHGKGRGRATAMLPATGNTAAVAGTSNRRGGKRTTAADATATGTTMHNISDPGAIAIADARMVVTDGAIFRGKCRPAGA